MSWLSREDEWALDAALAKLAAEVAAEAPPDGLETRLLAEFDAVARRRRQKVRLWPAVAATLAGAAWLSSPPGPVIEPFIRIPFTAPPAPYERTEVMRMTVPVAALIAAGFEVHVADAGAAVPAEVLVGQDGRALAIRFDRRINR
jgi:hypothetical protein